MCSITDLNVHDAARQGSDRGARGADLHYDGEHKRARPLHAHNEAQTPCLSRAELAAAAKEAAETLAATRHETVVTKPAKPAAPGDASTSSSASRLSGCVYSPPRRLTLILS